MELTASQLNVVQAERSNLLVSAAAGSGKTAVLTERIVQRILTGQLDVQHVLVVTFTEAAARHMREKIEEKLRSALLQERDPVYRQRIGQQLALLAGSAISTIHAFCLQVIYNFYHLAVDSSGQPLTEPGFTVQEQNESEALLRETLNDWLNEAYEAIDRGSFEDLFEPGSSVDVFYHLMDGFGNSRSDEPVRELMLSVYHYLRSLPDYPNLIRQHLDQLRAAANHFSESLYCQVIMDQLRLRLDRAMTVIPDLERRLAGTLQLLANKQRNEEAKAQFSAVLNALRTLYEKLPDGLKWDEVRAQINLMSELIVPANRAADSDEKRAFLEPFIESVSEAICFISGQCGTKKYSEHFLFDTRFTFNQSAAEIETEIQTMLPVIELFFQLVERLDERYTSRKRSAGVLDFSDFEHIALAILRQDEACQYYNTRFAEVYVDEYQDTSSIQETILQAVTRDNCLMVGDIKQSIYRFRHARPEIFQGKIEQFASGQGGRLLELNQNFRSVPGVLSAVNDVFAQLMSVGAGEIDYDEHHALVPYRKPLMNLEPAVQLLLVNRIAETDDEGQELTEQEQDDHVEDLSRDEREARVVVQAILQLHQDGRSWTEIAVLARTKSIIHTCREMAEAAGIPVASETGPSTFDLPVFQQLEALLQTLDNEHQDIPLAAFLRSGIAGVSLSLDQLAGIRLFGKEKNLDFFHEAVFAYQQKGPDATLRSQLSRCLNWLDTLRQREQILPLGELIEQIFTENGWINQVAAGPDGGHHVRVLRRFQTWTERYELNRRKGIFRLVQYLKNLRSLNQGDVPAESAAPAENAVRMMTIHGSKGLEFPIVLIPGLSRQLLGPDSKDCIVISEKMGIGFDFADPERRIRYPSRIKSAMMDELKASTQAEELRLLYVAMTRAMDRLFLIGSVNIEPEKESSRMLRLIEAARSYSSRSLPDHLVRSARSSLEWLILALARNPAVDLGFLGASAATGQTAPKPMGQSAVLGHYPDWSVTCVNHSDIRISEIWTVTADSSEQRSADQDRSEWLPPACTVDVLKKRILEPYRYDRAAQLPLKLTVSELKGRDMTDENDPDRSVAWQPATKPLRGIDQVLIRRQPEPDGQPLAGAELGTALHTVFRYLDFVAACSDPTAAEISRQVVQMVQTGLLSNDVLDDIQPFFKAMVLFVQSDLARSIVRAQLSIDGVMSQETPFTLMIPATEIYSEGAGVDAADQVLIQGMIDLWYRDENGITLIDFKSDDISGSPERIAAILKDRYSTQLSWYVRALEMAYNESVKRRVIWHIRSGLTVLV